MTQGKRFAFSVKLRLCRNEARSAREARLRRVKCLPCGKREGSFLQSKKPP
jgi:hypothetical protein